MRNLIVVNNPKSWDLHIKGGEVVSAREYLTDPKYVQLRGARVFNLCRSYSYQSTGYYVSLLAVARGHRPLPSIATIQDMKTLAIIRLADDDLEELIQESLTPIQSKHFTLSVYLGQNLARRYERLSMHLFKLFQAPMLQAMFARENGEWHLERVRPISGNEIPDSHRPFVVKVATEYFAEEDFRVYQRKVPAYTIAFLTDPAEEWPPSNKGAMRKFTRAARRLGMGVEMIQKDDYGRLAEFDALFIRETTSVDHHTYRFARRAAAEGLVVIDDPDSIVKCGNKVYLAELLARYNIPTPKTVIVHSDNLDAVLQQVGLPCILKNPDSSFSRGVIKVEDEAAFRRETEQLLEESDLIIAQEFLPTPFDWRVTVLDRQVLFVCKYFMAEKHWQIRKTDQLGESEFGRVEAVAPGGAPQQVVRTALRAANLIGDGLYGVDMKQIGRKAYVIEINDNPNVDSGYDDTVLKDQVYMRVMESFRRRIEQRKNAWLY